MSTKGREENNKNSKKEYQKKWVQSHKEYRRKWDREHKEHLKEYRREWEKNNQERSNATKKKWRDNHKERISEYRKKYYRYREQIKEEMVQYKGGQCSECGYNKCLAALEFHHIDPFAKEFELSEAIHGMLKRDGSLDIAKESAKKELDKCVLLCANCHREKHYGQKAKYSSNLSNDSFEMERDFSIS